MYRSNFGMKQFPKFLFLYQTFQNFHIILMHRQYLKAGRSLKMEKLLFRSNFTCQLTTVI